MKWFVGTYSKRNSEGIYLIDFDESNGKFELINSFGEQSPSNPSFLATDIDNKYLYSVGESGSPNPGVVVSYSINNNNLEKINEEFTKGDNPCHLAVNSKNDYLVAVNYSSGDFSTYSLDQGKISFIEKKSHEGSSINTERQNEPHAHSINFLDDDNFFVCDLGIDKIIKYSLNQQTKKIKSSKAISTTPGSGPRHFVINKNDKLAYSINELDSTITSFRIDEKNDISSFQNISTIPLDYTHETTTSDLHFSLGNKFLYGSNRGHDSIAQFEVKTDGSLKFLNHFSTLGKTPRNFGISNSNKFALVANENSDTIYSFYINKINGSFEPTGNKIEIPSPVCLLEIFK